MQFMLSILFNEYYINIECAFFLLRMKDVEVDGTKVLLVRDSGKFHAIGAKCSHYGASLSSGKKATVLTLVTMLSLQDNANGRASGDICVAFSNF